MRFQRATVLAMAALCLSRAALAQDTASSYPNKAVHIVVGYQAGGPTDAAARLLASRLQASLGQPFLVENKPGAGSNIASGIVANSQPDGYTLLLAAAPITMNGLLYKNLRWDVQKSFDPVSMVMSAPGVLAVAPDVPARNLQELIALAKKQPGKLTFGSTGNGGSQHIAGEMLKLRAGIDIIHVPYKGAAGALQDLMSGQITMAFMTSVSSMPLLKSGKVRPIAVAAKRRLPQMPDLPTMSEAGLPGFESDSWNGMFVPKGTPPAIIAKLNAEIVKAVKSPEFRDAMESQGGVMVADSPSQFRDVIAQEVDHWTKLFQTINVKVD